MRTFNQLVFIALGAVWFVGVLSGATFGYGGYGVYGGGWPYGGYGLNRYAYGYYNNPFYYRRFARMYDPFYTSRGGYFNRGGYGNYYGGYYL
ncbi:prisilkin-39-like [Varroa jacobsoni]|uniref:Uncharacterized protein n=1 Tax=Varroa destructor TaxID=109461 RepID=A0A7M7J887_VARDE|nr:prisilkin-39-like [Varroa destructor]XP_022698814.1 prisilkin-39-like [Varroa jacobsoni]